MNFLLLLIGIVLFSIYNTIIKLGNSRCRNNASLILYNCLLCAVAAIIAFAFSDKNYTLSIYTYAAAIIFGILFCITSYLYMKTIQNGQLSLSALIVTFSLIIPLMYSFVFLNERLSYTKAFGIALLIACMLVSSNLSAGDRKASAKWFLLAFMTLLSNGFLSTVSKAHQVITVGAFVGQFVALGYSFAALCSFLLFCYVSRHEKADVRYFFNPVMLLLVFVTSISSFGANYIVTDLAATMDGSVIYPAVQGGALVIVTLCSVLFLNEKMNLRKFTTIGMGIVSVILLNI